ncbi:hypothetical protein EV424DRAFT_1349310 [Suillus variegatus]|nr:hypothetical protein EV424DRAFT_1349310 [Suillus variegatus]
MFDRDWFKFDLKNTTNGRDIKYQKPRNDLDFEGTFLSRNPNMSVYLHASVDEKYDVQKQVDIRDKGYTGGYSTPCGAESSFYDMFAVTIFGSFKPQVAGFGLWHRITKLQIVGSNSKLGDGFCNTMMVWPRSRATLPSQLRRITNGYHRSTAVINQRMSGAVKVRERTRFAKITLLHHRFFVLQDNEGSMPHFKDCMKLSAPWLKRKKGIKT